MQPHNNFLYEKYPVLTYDLLNIPKCPISDSWGLYTLHILTKAIMQQYYFYSCTTGWPCSAQTYITPYMNRHLEQTRWTGQQANLLQHIYSNFLWQLLVAKQLTCIKVSPKIVDIKKDLHDYYHNICWNAKVNSLPSLPQWCQLK